MMKCFRPAKVAPEAWRINEFLHGSRYHALFVVGLATRRIDNTCPTAGVIAVHLENTHLALGGAPDGSPPW
ncbi:MAG: hypothetical protein ACR2RV_13775 [Verrucomicrobiales bacterium]